MNSRLLEILKLVLGFLKASTYAEPLSTRYLHFGDVKPGKHLSGSELELLRDTSQIICGLKCAKHPKCLSFNFCKPRICELNSDDIFSIGPNVESLRDLLGCVYVGMRKEDVPFCKEGPVEINIQNDTHPGICSINGKRVDKEVSSWIDVMVDNATDWMEGRSRDVIRENAHGGKGGDEPSKDFPIWFKWVVERRTWSLAKEKCEDLNGKLFTRLNGDEQQLQSFCERSGLEYYWLGFVRKFVGSSLTWESVNGDEETTFQSNQWARNEPSTGSKENVIMFVCQSSQFWSGFHDDSENSQRSSICDMSSYH